MPKFFEQHLLDIESLDNETILDIVNVAKTMKTGEFSPLMKNRTAVLMFAENSSFTLYCIPYYI